MLHENDSSNERGKWCINAMFDCEKRDDIACRLKTEDQEEYMFCVGSRGML